MIIKKIGEKMIAKLKYENSSLFFFHNDFKLFPSSILNNLLENLKATNEKDIKKIIIIPAGLEAIIQVIK